jgi:WD40 repeat protein
MSASVEFDRFMGLNTIADGTKFHPDGQHYVFSNGGNLIIGDLIDTQSQVFMRQHDDFVTSIALSSSGNMLASGQTGANNGNADVLVWDFEQRTVLYRLEELDSEVISLAFSLDEKILATIDDTKLILWDLSNGCIIASGKLPQGTKCVVSGGFVKDIKRRNTPNYLFCTGGEDGMLLWDLEPFSGDVVCNKLVGDVRATITRQINAVAFSDDREFLYGATTSGDYVIANLKSNRIVHAVQATKKALNCIVAYNEGVVVGCGDGTIKVFGPAGELKGSLTVDDAVISLSQSPDQVELLATTASGTVSRVNLKTLQSIDLTESHVKSINTVVFDEGGHDRFATSSQDGTLKVWDIVECVVVTTCRPLPGQHMALPTCLAFADMLYSGWSDGRILAHSAEDGSILWSVDNSHKGSVTAMALSHNRRFLLTGGMEGEVRLWELRSRELISHLKEHKLIVTSIKLFDDDTVALSCSRDRCILRWDLRSEKRSHCHMQRMGGINDFVLTKNEGDVISVGQDKKIVVWNNRDNNPDSSMFINDEEDEGRSVVLSHDGRFIATGGSEGVLRLWEVIPNGAPGSGASPSLSLVSESKGHSKGINSVAFSLDDKQVVTVGEDGAIFVWCVYT